MQQENKSDYIDLKEVLDRILKKWPLFIVSIFGFMVLAVFYLIITPKQYEVGATMQLEHESLADKGIGNEKFISGHELLEGTSELEDEIGILSSHQMVGKAIDILGFEVSLYAYENQFNFLGERISEEVYKGPIEIVLNPNTPQVIHTPIHIEFLDSTRYKITGEGEGVPVLDLVSQDIIENLDDFTIDKEANISEGYSNEYLSFGIIIDPEYEIKAGEKYFFIVNNRQSLIKQYAGGLQIASISKGSNIVSLRRRGRTPDKEIDFINTLMNVYINYDLNKKNQLGLKTVEFIDKQLITVYDSLVNVESNLEVFRSSNQIIDIGKTSTELAVQLQRLEEEEAELRVQREYFIYVLNALRKTEDVGEIAPSSVGINNPFFNDLLVELTALNKEKIDKSYSSKPNSPVIRVIDEKIANVKARLIDNTNNLIKSTDITLNDSRQRKKQLQIRIDALPESERNLVSIERDFALNDNIYNYLLQKRAEATIALASNLPDKTVIDEARKLGRKPVSPNTKLILAIALILGLATPLAFIIISDFLNNRLRNKDSVGDLFGAPVLQTISHYKQRHVSKQQKKFTPLPGHEFRFLAMNILNKYKFESTPVIGMTSAQAGTGTSMMAYNLALTYSRFGKKVLFVDLDFHKAKRSFKPDLQLSETHVNVSDHLFHEDRNILERTILNPVKNLYVIPSGEEYGSIDDLVVIHMEKIRQLLDTYREEYDMIIADLPSLVDHIDFNSVSRYFDLNIMVVRHNFTPKKKIVEARDLLLANTNKPFEIIYSDFSN